MWVPRLNEALRHDHFRLFVMPIIGLNGDQPPHEEVLLRLANGQGTLIQPGAFIPAAERYHIMPLIDRWVLQAACSYLGGWRRAAQEAGLAYQPRRLSINLSGLSMNDDQLIGFITSQLAAYDVEPAHLCFEITETAAIGNLPKAQALMRSLKALGCSFSLDDFGSGLSSFTYLKSLPVDYIKIDGAFIRDVATNPVHLAMVEAIHKVGQVMGIRTVAEYVEDGESLAVLRALGVNFAQGHAVGVPTELIYANVE
jgi:EAL domain-containing protein (putative c-di-GMP-specific phosphodiesterase class I)